MKWASNHLKYIALGTMVKSPSSDVTTEIEEPPLPVPKFYPVRDKFLYSLYQPPPDSDSVPTGHEDAIVLDIGRLWALSRPPTIVNLAIGSWQLRAGFSTDTHPRFTCTPQVARYRDRKANKTYTICGNDVTIDAACKAQSKSPFDANVISNFDVLENLLDYTFLNLGLEGDGSGGVGHPILMTEAVCNPNYSRRGT